MLSFGSLATAVTAPNLGYLSTKLGYKNMLIFSNLLYILSMIIIPAIGIKWLILLPSAIFGIAQGINIPGIQTLLAGSAPTQYRAAFMSVNGSVLRLGQTLGPVIVGMAYVAGGFSWAFYTGAGTALIIILLLIFIAGKFSE